MASRHFAGEPGSGAAAGRLSPVLDDIGIAPAVPRLVGTVHRYTLELRAEPSAGQHPPGAVAAGIRARDEDRRVVVGRQPVTRVDQLAEKAFRARTWPHGPELDVAGSAAG